MRKPAHLALKLALFLLFAVLAGLAVLFPYQCPIRGLTGVICPGCGMGRAWLEAFHLNFKQALYYHPMFWVIPVVMLFALYDFNLLGKRLFNIVVLSLLGVAVAMTYILRLMAFLQGVYTI
ncbi:MAG: DUF2752 domain-containing protein [Lachnospiraceae bacterium]|nr:DUF2752 domain-containing protein [Lachnospiraceae bacterium]